MYVTLIVF